MNADQTAMLNWVRRVLEAALKGLPDPTPEGLPAVCVAKQGCFVTLSRGGQLRGCIGHILPQQPLGQGLAECARSAAFADHRFPALEPEEWPDLEIEVSLLSPLQPLAIDSPEALLSALRPQQDGVWLEAGARRATFLPQVWAQLPEPEAFLIALSRKAGGPDDLWRQPGTRFQTYRVTAFRGPAQP